MPGPRLVHPLRALLGPIRCLSVPTLVLALAAGASSPAAASGRGAASPLGIRIVKVDSDAFAGAENAIYAASTSRVYVAYKVPHPAAGAYWPSDLRVARSADGGSTWEIDVVDGPPSHMHLIISGGGKSLERTLASPRCTAQNWNALTPAKGGEDASPSCRCIAPFARIVPDVGASRGGWRRPRLCSEPLQGADAFTAHLVATPSRQRSH